LLLALLPHATSLIAALSDSDQPTHPLDTNATTLAWGVFALLYDELEPVWKHTFELDAPEYIRAWRGQLKVSKNMHARARDARAERYTTRGVTTRIAELLGKAGQRISAARAEAAEGSASGGLMLATEAMEALLAIVAEVMTREWAEAVNVAMCTDGLPHRVDGSTESTYEGLRCSRCFAMLATASRVASADRG
jgi:hypothetical protein